MFSRFPVDFNNIFGSQLDLPKLSLPNFGITFPACHINIITLIRMSPERRPALGGLIGTDIFEHMANKPIGFERGM